MKIFGGAFWARRHSQARRRAFKERARRGGSTLVETALCVAFVLLPLTLGGLQYGLILTTTHSLEQVARESGRFAAVHYGESTFGGAESQGDVANSQPSLKHYVRDVASANGIPWNDIKNSIAVTYPMGGEVGPGQAVTVSITYPMRKRLLMGSFGTSNGKVDLGGFKNDYTVGATFLTE